MGVSCAATTGDVGVLFVAGTKSPAKPHQPKGLHPCRCLGARCTTPKSRQRPEPRQVVTSVTCVQPHPTSATKVVAPGRARQGGAGTSNQGAATSKPRPPQPNLHAKRGACPDPCSSRERNTGVGARWAPPAVARTSRTGLWHCDATPLLPQPNRVWGSGLGVANPNLHPNPLRCHAPTTTNHTAQAATTTTPQRATEKAAVCLHRHAAGCERARAPQAHGKRHVALDS